METIQTTLDSTLEAVDQAEDMVLAEAGKLGLEDEDAHQVGMAVRECMVNAVVHGNRYNKNKRIHINIERSNDSLTVLIGDEGTGFDINALPDPLSQENIMRQSGRGLMLARAFMDDFDVHSRPGGGTEVRLMKKSSKA